jgi:hypothetical protein
VLRSMTALAVLAILLGFAPADAQAQSPETSLRVSVADATGAVLVGARITVRHSDVDVRAVTNERGEATVTGLTAGVVDLRVESEGFEPHVQAGRHLRAGVNRADVRMQIAKIAEQVEVTRDARDRQTDARGEAFARVLTAEQIAQLPDDPDALEKALKQMAGPGATIRVNGFGGARLPPKSQIRQIRFNMNLFSAETHDMGNPLIDVISAPGTDAWRTGLNAGYRGAAMTGRNAFSPTEPTEHLLRTVLTFDGPLWKQHTSLSVTVQNVSSADSQTILASLPTGLFAAAVSRPVDRSDFSVTLQHALNKTHTARFELERIGTASDNLGLTQTDMPERAYSSGQRSWQARFADSGSLGRTLFNEARVQAAWLSQDARPTTLVPAVLVLGAFSRGGAQVDNRRASWEIEAADNLDFTWGRQAFRVGGLVRAGHYESWDRNNVLGTFTFPDLAAFEAGRATTYSTRRGDPFVEYGFQRLGLFLQDDVRVHKSVTLSGGMRYEVQSHLADRSAVVPRAGVVWSPSKSGKTVVRGGAGVYSNWFEPATYEQTLRVNGTRQYDLVVRNPAFPNASESGESMVLPPGRYLQAADLRMPRVTHLGLNVLRVVTARVALTAGYTHQRGSGLFRGRNLNAPLPTGVRPYPDEGNVIQVESAGRSTLDRLDLMLTYTVMKNMKPTVMLFATYSLGRQMNDTDGPFSLPADGHRPDAEWSAAASDVRHNAVATLMAPLPKGVRVMAIGWCSSAAPYNMTTGYDDNGDTVSNDRPAGVGRNSARGASQWDVMARVSWAIGFGKARHEPGISEVIARARNGGDGMGALSSFDAQGHRYRLELYALVQNVFNHVNLIAFNGVATSTFFGRATAALPARRLEIGTRFDF